MCEPKAATTSERKPLRGHSSEDTYQPNLQPALGTLSFTVCFAAWGLISAFAPRFREAFHLTVTQTAFRFQSVHRSDKRPQAFSQSRSSIA